MPSKYATTSNVCYYDVHALCCHIQCILASERLSSLIAMVLSCFTSKEQSREDNHECNIYGNKIYFNTIHVLSQQ